MVCWQFLLLFQKHCKADIISKDYWSQQMLNTIQFSDGVKLLNENDNVVYLEVGPNNHLSSFVKENSAVKKKEAIISAFWKPE